MAVEKNYIEDKVSYHGDNWQLVRYSLPINYTIGTDILFYGDGYGRFYEKSGFSRCEELFTWSNGETGELSITLSNYDGNSDLMLYVDLKKVYNDRQNVIISVDDKILLNVIVDEDNKSMSVCIPSDMINEDSITINFEYPSSLSPMVLGKSEDGRELSIAISKMKLIYKK